MGKQNIKFSLWKSSTQMLLWENQKTRWCSGWARRTSLSSPAANFVCLCRRYITLKQAQFKGNFQRVLESFSSNKALDAQLSENQDTVNDNYAQISSVIDTLTPAPELSSQETVLLAVLTITLQVMFGSLS